MSEVAQNIIIQQPFHEKLGHRVLPLERTHFAQDLLSAVQVQMKLSFLFIEDLKNKVNHVYAVYHESRTHIIHAQHHASS